MIKINLLSIPKARKVKKQMEIQYELILAGVLIGFVVVACTYFWYLMNSRIDRLRNEKTKANAELTVLKEKVKEVENYEGNKKVLEEKNKIIEQLKKNQGAPVRLLDEISKSMEPLKIWLTTVKEEGSQVEVDGKAVTNADIVQFINNLKTTKFFSDIQLIESRQAIELNVPIYSFKLKCTMVI
ncbi:MAG TPA: PilN domain-containing protein [Nitrospiria bacterium]|jgi:type IV pilus assembly protein PilN|nr:PilN domain-containing protein [Nitrospiria bacterium]